MKSKQITFSDIEYGNRKRITKREEFFDTMEELIPWDEWEEFVRRITLRTCAADLQRALKLCSECICFRIGSISRTKALKMRFMTAMLFANS